MDASLPQRGVAAHRGGPAHAPENTRAALQAAVRLGAHQVEFDLRATADGHCVLMHDKDVERTTDGRGRVAAHTLAQLRELDAGRGFDGAFAGERIPTLEEALEGLPDDVWINVQIKRGEPVVADVARAIADSGRVGQTLVACGNAHARELAKLLPGVAVCNLVRQRTRARYVEHAIATGARFVQFHHLRGLPEPDLVARARAAGLGINFFCAPDAPDVGALFDAGVDFVLVDDVRAALEVAASRGIAPRTRPENAVASSAARPQAPR
ncbi:MAG: glycerophosphodiester phosphodiesterase [Proteobacteria bacterium]|nr:glycerophosphodiester phosphodiesterase [Pseudomonadota bacterium]